MQITNIGVAVNHATTATEAAKTPRANSTLFQKENVNRKRTMQQLLSLFLILLSFTHAKAQWADFEVNVRVDGTDYIGGASEICNKNVFLPFANCFACSEYSDYGWRANIKWNENGVNISRIRSEDATGEADFSCDPILTVGPVLLGNAINDLTLQGGQAGKIFLSNPIQKNSQYSTFPFFFFEDDGTYSSSLTFVSGADAAAQGSYKIFLTQKPPTANTNFVEVIDELNSCTDGSCNDWYDTKFQVAWQYVPPADISQIFRPGCFTGGVVNQSYDPFSITAPCFPSWAVYLEGGKNYKFSTPNSFVNTVLRLYDTDGYNLVATSNIDNSLVNILQQRGEITYSVPTSGVYYLEMSGVSISDTRLAIAPFSIFTISMKDTTPTITFPELAYCSSNDVLPNDDSLQNALQNYNSGCAISGSFVVSQELYNFPKVVTRVYSIEEPFNNYVTTNETYSIANVAELVAGGIIQNSDGTLSTGPWMNYINNLPSAVYAELMALNAAHYQYTWIDHTDFDEIIYTGGPICNIPSGAEYHEFYLIVSYDNVECISQTPLWSKPIVPDTIAECNAYTWPVNGQTYTTSGNYTNSDKISFFNSPITYPVALSAAGYLSTPTETFDTYPVGGIGTFFPNNFGNGLPTWTATCTGGLNILNTSGTNLYGWANVLGASSNVPMTISFSSGVTSVAGDFFSLNFQNDVTPSTIAVTLSNGVTQSFTTNSIYDYFGGFVSHDAFISSITIASSLGRPAVNGLVASTGTITPCVNCVNAALALTITPSTTNTTILSACGSYTWPVNGQTYTQGGSYNAVNGCDTQILALTVNSNVTPAPTGNATQTFVSGNTIANIVVAGSNLIWYATNNDALAQTNPLAPTTVLVNGATYYVTQTLAGCPSAPLAVLVTASLGADSFDSLPFSYAPNPTSGVLTISYSKAISQIDVLNLVGQTVLHQSANASEVQVDLSSLANATYFVKVVAEGKTKTFKVVKD